MNPDCRFVRIKVGIASLIVYFLLANFVWLAKAPDNDFPNEIGDDRIAAYEMRFKDLKEMLPPRSVVGYVTDEELSDETFHQLPPDNSFRFRAVLHYHLTQYALAPIIVDNTLEHELVVGNFRTPHAMPPVRGHVLLKDFGNGIMLFRRGLK